MTPGGGDRTSHPRAFRSARTAKDMKEVTVTTTSAEAVAEGQGAVVLLDQTRAAVHPQLRSTVESLPSSIRRVAMYHFG